MLIYEFQKNVLEKVKIEITEFNGSDYLNIRSWFEDDSNVWRPSHKGITLAVEKIGDLKKGIDLAAEYLEKAEKAEKQPIPETRPA